MDSKRFEIPFFILLITFAVGLVAFIFFPYLDAIVLAIALAILFHPVYILLQRYMPNWKALSALITVLFAMAVIIIPVIFFGVKIFQEAQMLYMNFISGNTGPVIGFLHDKLNTFIPWLNIDLSQYVKQLLEIVVASLGPLFSRAANLVITIFLALSAFYYLLMDAERLKKSVMGVIPLSAVHTEKIIRKLGNMASSVIRGSLIVAIIQGTLVGLGFFIFGLQNPVLWGTIAIVVSFIPVVGTAIVIIPGMISMILSGNAVSSIGFALWCFLLVGLVDVFLRPRLIERDVKIHPMLVLFSVLGGMVIFGATGFILGPLALSLLLALIQIYPELIKSQ